ncbi:hypothetical protein F4802DRAFT_543971 [Xylaria palmicola]|nr:hypothetical protein F4802DRAFT_543971 [Xylaria palmicola]
MPSPVNPRKFFSSRADPEERERRKQLEKESAVGLTEVAVLGLIGLTLAWDIEKQVQKREEKKEKEEEAEHRRREDRERRRREAAHRDGTFDPRRDYGASDGGGRRSARDGRSATAAAESCARDSGRRRQSVDYRADARYEDRYRDRRPRYDPRGDRPYDGPYDDPRHLDPAGGRRSRRDSW